LDLRRPARLDVGLATSGTLTHWFRDNAARELDPAQAFARLAREAEASPPGSKGLVVLPYFSGERTPIHDPHAKGVLFGLNLTHNRGDIYRAFLEGIAYGTNHIFETYPDAGARRGACWRRRRNEEQGLVAGDVRVSGLPQVAAPRSAPPTAMRSSRRSGSATRREDIRAWNGRLGDHPRSSGSTGANTSTAASTRERRPHARVKDEQDQSTALETGDDRNPREGLQPFLRQRLPDRHRCAGKGARWQRCEAHAPAGHLVATEFPSTLKALSAYDVVV
jgi:hypothetical protein